MNPQIQKTQQIPIRTITRRTVPGVSLTTCREKRKTISVNREYAQKIKMGMTPEATVLKMTERHHRNGKVSVSESVPREASCKIEGKAKILVKSSFSSFSSSTAALS